VHFTLRNVTERFLSCCKRINYEPDYDVKRDGNAPRKSWGVVKRKNSGLKAHEKKERD